MQRQSLGSPLSKLHSHGVPPNKKDDATHKHDSTHFSDDDIKPPRRFSSSSSSTSSSSSSASSSFCLSPAKLVHFIPLLTLFCFLILYLVSHTPSPSDLAQFNGFKRSSKHNLDAASDIDRFGDARKGAVVAITNLRNLQEIGVSPKFRIHRKIIPDF